MLYYLHGSLGSVTGLADADGGLVEKYEYDPYGRTYILAPNGTARTSSSYGNPFAWTGQRYDPAVRLYHFWARSYSPALGRWLQRDPAKYIGGLSLYQYVRGGAVRRFDPLGLMDPDAVDQCPFSDSDFGWLDALMQFLYEYSPVRGVWVGVGAQRRRKGVASRSLNRGRRSRGKVPADHAD